MESWTDLYNYSDKTNGNFNDQIRGLGYVGGSSVMPDKTGVTIHNPETTEKGLNFYCGGHGPKATLVDMNGKKLHEWVYSWNKAFGDTSPPPNGLSSNDETQWWRNCFLFPGGKVLGLFEGWGILMLDRDSNIIWKKKESFHHDLEKIGDKIYILGRKKINFYRASTYKTNVIEDFIVVLDFENGEEVNRYSIYRALLNSPYQSLIARTRGTYNPKGADIVFRKGDQLHPNSIQILDATNSFVSKVSEKSGKHALISFRNNNAIVLMSLKERTIVWALRDLMQGQHDAEILSNGNLIMFDNWGNHHYEYLPNRSVKFRRMYSAILEVDPITQNIIWDYKGNSTNEFFSKCCGLVQRLKENTLVVSTAQGKAFEVTPDKEVVWEFVNPHTSAEDSTKVGNLFKLKRIPSDFDI